MQKGDLKSARAAARRAASSEREAPEPYNLLGYIAAQEGEAEEALDHYRHAMALDEGYLDPLLNAAELLVHSMGEYAEAVQLCDEVLGMLEEREGDEGRDEFTDAVIFKTEAQLALGDREAARTTLAALPEGAFEPPMAAMVGRLFADVGEAERAEGFLRIALEADPRNVDVVYSLGLVCELRHDHRNASLHWLSARELLAAEPPAPWALSIEAMRTALTEALERLDAELKDALQGALMLVAELPGIEVVADGVDPRTTVLFEGGAGPGEKGPVATRVILYQRNLERVCQGADEVPEELAFVLTEELRHQLAQRARPAGAEGTLEAGGAQNDGPRRN